MSAISRVSHLKGHLASTPNSIGSQATGAISPAAQKVLDTRKEVKILDSYMSYLDTGVGDKTVVFLHGNPAAAFLWRNVIPHVSPIARCLAPDLIGMGRSGKEPNYSYRFVDHFKYLSAWFDAMKLTKKVTIVCQDWGSGLGFHWCNLNRDRVEAIVFFEAMIGTVPKWDLFPEAGREFFKRLRSSEGEDMVLKKNLFAGELFRSSLMYPLSDEEMAEYQRPYLEEGESRRPTLTFPRQIPIEGEPEDVTRFVKNYRGWLATDTNIPKLFIDAEPGFFSRGMRRGVADWPNMKTVKAKGLHFIQEDDPHTVGQAAYNFLKDLYAKN